MAMLRVRGIAAGAGIAVGRARVLDGRFGVPLRYIPPNMVELEVERLRRAAVESHRSVVDLLANVRGTDGASAAALLEPLVLMHEDPMLTERAAERIRELGVNAEHAVLRAVDDVSTNLLGSGSTFFRERADDVRHVGRHLIRALRGARRAEPAIEPAIVVAEALSPAELASYPRSLLLGIAMTSGSGTSHTALLARSLGIPAVVGARLLPVEHVDGHPIVVDGLRGEVLVDPGLEQEADARLRHERFQAFSGQLEARRDLPVATTDGVEVELRANLEMPSEVSEIVRHGISGVGLFRTEYLVLARGAVPDEGDQTRVYEGVVRELEGRPLVLRTFDLGGDKVRDDAAFASGRVTTSLGRSGLRHALLHPDELEVQLRSVLRAAALGPVSVLFPRVSRLAEILAARCILERCQRQLEEAGEPMGEVKVGIMIEVPAAALLAEQFASCVDFFAVGTNDLTQFTLAIDRGDELMAEAADPLDPAVLELVGRAVRAARLAGIPCSVCGDVASDPVALPLLVGMGVNALSLPRDRVPIVAEAIRRISSSEAKIGVERALELASAEAVRDFALHRFAPRLADLWVEQGIVVP